MLLYILTIGIAMVLIFLGNFFWFPIDYSLVKILLLDLMLPFLMVAWDGISATFVRRALPEKWFTKDQIEAFIKENYTKPATYEELLIQERLLEIEKYIPEVKDEYYQFPKSWEENGLADLVREVCCLNM